jgi:hypothetical protein
MNDTNILILENTILFMIKKNNFVKGKVTKENAVDIFVYCFAK